MEFKPFEEIMRELLAMQPPQPDRPGEAAHPLLQVMQSEDASYIALDLMAVALRNKEALCFDFPNKFSAVLVEHGVGGMWQAAILVRQETLSRLLIIVGGLTECGALEEAERASRLPHASEVML